MSLYLVALAALPGHTPASPLTERVIVEPDVIPAGDGFSGSWTIGARCRPNDVLTVSLIAKQPGSALARLEEALAAVSDPTSPRYGNYLDVGQVAQLSAQEDAVGAITAWLQTAGDANVTSSVGSTRDVVHVELACTQAERLFRTRIHHYVSRHLPGRTLLRAAIAVTLPTGIARHVATVSPLVRLPYLPLPRHASSESAATPAGAAPGWTTGCGTPSQPLCAGRVTPAILAQRYALGTAPAGKAYGSIAVAEFQGVQWDQYGLDAFAAACLPFNVTVDHQVGPNQPTKCGQPIIGGLCDEAMLDIEYIKAVAGSIPLTNIYHDGYSLEGWANAVLQMPKASLPLVHSISYANDERQAPDTPAYDDATNALFMKLGLRGVTIVVAAGDQGVWGHTGPSSTSPRFHPQFPASSPYVTTVGGTDFAQQGVVGDEVAWDSGGGGFSEFSAAGQYQRTAVARYLATASLPDPQYFNASGRAYPDVAALAGKKNPYCVAVEARMSSDSGTSAASPVFAGIVAKLNEERLAVGKPPMGFVNPFLYQHPEAFHDVTVGENKGAGQFGFKAAPGWDPASGLGTPNYPALRKAAVAGRV